MTPHDPQTHHCPHAVACEKRRETADRFLPPPSLRTSGGSRPFVIGEPGALPKSTRTQSPLLKSPSGCRSPRSPPKHTGCILGQPWPVCAPPAPFQASTRGRRRASRCGQGALGPKQQAEASRDGPRDSPLPNPFFSPSPSPLPLFFLFRRTSHPSAGPAPPLHTPPRPSLGTGTKNSDSPGGSLAGRPGVARRAAAHRAPMACLKHSAVVCN